MSNENENICNESEKSAKEDLDKKFIDRLMKAHQEASEMSQLLEFGLMIAKASGTEIPEGIDMNFVADLDCVADIVAKANKSDNPEFLSGDWYTHSHIGFTDAQTNKRFIVVKPKLGKVLLVGDHENREGDVAELLNDIANEKPEALELGRMSYFNTFLELLMWMVEND